MSLLDRQVTESVIDLAHAAGDAIMAIYRDGFSVQTKDDASPLTQADLAAHRLIVAGLTQLTPDIPVLSEESALVPWAMRRQWTRYWLVDPLDGTREFIKRNGEFSVNIALIDDGQAVFGVIQAPVDGRLWHAWRDGPALRREAGQDVALRVRAPATAPLRVAASRSHRGPRTDALLSRMGEVEVLAQGSSLKFCRIADGELDVYPRFGPTSEWDTAAGQCVLEAAGGQLLAADSGQPFRYNQRETLLNGDFMAFGDPGLPWREWL
ncbi:MAG TPA: 3'(2'),5'-bisphosphate nucleotidase CysQ [Stenotrophomonas sp.]|jgi:3'(2'), 5'-bisphosphate nucleotidase